MPDPVSPEAGPTTAPRTRDRRPPEERREQILAEAVRLISEKGYYGFVVREVAERCGLTEPGLLHHFGSKERLLIAVLEDRDRRDRAVIGARLQVRSSATRAEALKAFHEIVAYNATRPELVRLHVVLRAEALNAAHPAHAFFLERQKRVVDAYIKLVAPHVEDPPATALALAGLMHGLEQEWLRQNQGFDLAAVWDRAAAQLMGG